MESHFLVMEKSWRIIVEKEWSPCDEGTTWLPARYCGCSTVLEVVTTFRMRHSRGEMYIGLGRLCVCLSLGAFPHYCTDPDAA